MSVKLLLGVYFQNMHSAITGSLQDADGTIQTGVLGWYGYGLASALHTVLQDAPQAKHLTVFCNHQGLVEAFTRPIRLALPDTRKQGRKTIPCGNENQWNVARDLAHYERWQFVYTVNIPKAKELYDSKR